MATNTPDRETDFADGKVAQRTRVISIATDDGEMSWSRLDDPKMADPDKHDTSDIVLGGILTGPEKMVRSVRASLAGVTDPGVAINYWYTYTYTPQRDTLADLVVAFIAAAPMQRYVLSETGWNVLHEAAPALIDPENNRDDVIY